MQYFSQNPKLLPALLLFVAAVMNLGYSKLFHERVQTDIYLPWRAARAVFLEHRNPYSQQLTAESQRLFYGRELQSSELHLDQRRFAYPVFVTFLLVPVIGLPISQAQNIVLILLSAITVLSVVFWLQALCWHTAKLLFFGLVAVTLTSPPALQGLALRQLGILVAALIAAAAAAAKGRKFLLAGSLLALATIKPQESLLTIALLLFWALNDWRSRKNLAFGFGGSVLALIIGGELVSPGWIIQFLWSLMAYRKYGGASGAEMLLGERLGVLFTALALIWVVRRVWKARSDPDFMPSLALILAVQVLIVPGLFALYNWILFIPALLLLAKNFFPTVTDQLTS
jgi:hypothetical protein